MTDFKYLRMDFGGLVETKELQYQLLDYCVGDRVLFEWNLRYIN